MKYKHRNNAKGMVLIIVLILVGVITIVGLGFVVRGDTELAISQNMKMKADIDYLADSGLEHAKGMLLAPQDVAGEFWSGSTGNQLVSGSSDYYDVSVSKITDLNFQITSTAYRMQKGSRLAEKSLTANLRLDPAVAFFTDVDCRLNEGFSITGDVYCDGDLENDSIGTSSINGDVYTELLTGNLCSGQVKADSDLDFSWPAISAPYLAANLPTQIISGSSLSNITLSGSSTVYYRIGNLELKNNVVINGCLVVTGSLTITGSSNVITAKKNAPAIFVAGNLVFKDGAKLEINGLAVVNGTMQMYIYNQSLIVNGSIIIDDGFKNYLLQNNIFGSYGKKGLEGTVYGDCSWAAGKVGSAVQFDGTGDYMDLGSSGTKSDFRITRDIAVTAWIKTSSTSPAYQGIITKGNDSWRLQKNDNTNCVEFAITVDDPYTTTSYDITVVGTRNINDGQWHHIVGMYSEKISIFETDTLDLYVDGALDKRIVFDPTKTEIRIHKSTNSVYIGANSGVSNRNFNGCIDDVTVYDRYLEPSEITDMYNNGTIPEYGLLGYWTMNCGNCMNINAAPLKASIWHWPGGVKSRWSPATGAFYKSIVRN